MQEGQLWNHGFFLEFPTQEKETVRELGYWAAQRVAFCPEWSNVYSFTKKNEIRSSARAHVLFNRFVCSHAVPLSFRRSWDGLIHLLEDAVVKNQKPSILSFQEAGKYAKWDSVKRKLIRKLPEKSNILNQFFKKFTEARTGINSNPQHK